MKLSEFTHRIQAKLPECIQNSIVLGDRRALIQIDPGDLLRVAKYLYETEKCRFIIASGMDTNENLEILYHFSYDPEGYIINVQVVLPYEQPEIDSLTGLFEAADWIECEMHEILGILFRNHKNLKPLVSDGNWKSGTHPYRKRDVEPITTKP